MGGPSSDDISSCLIGETITIFVGPKNKRYWVHKALLIRYTWFNARDFGGYISLDKEDPKVFELFISWLYRQNLKAISTTDEDAAKKEVEVYINLYLRACVWKMPELQNALLDRVRVRTTCAYGFFPRKLINTIYEHTKPSSPLRSYIVDSFIYKGVEWDENGGLLDPIDANHILTRKRALRVQLEAGNQDFVLDRYEALFQLCAKSKIRGPDRKTGCVYHAHEHGGPCVR